MGRLLPSLVSLAALACVFATGLKAQGPDPAELKRILEGVEQQLAEIDRLLLESSVNKGRGLADAAEQAGQAADRMKDLLNQSQQASEKAVSGMDELIKKLLEMSRQGGGGGGGGQPMPGNSSGQGGQQKEPGQRQENETPDFQQRQEAGQEPGQQPGQNQMQPGGEQPQSGQPQDGSQPSGPDQATGAGENRQGQDPTSGATGDPSKTGGAERWGDLPPYLQFLRSRGSPPQVPAKYRKVYEQWLKRQRQAK